MLSRLQERLRVAASGRALALSFEARRRHLSESILGFLSSVGAVPVLHLEVFS